MILAMETEYDMFILKLVLLRYFCRGRTGGGACDLDIIVLLADSKMEEREGMEGGVASSFECRTVWSASEPWLLQHNQQMQGH